MNHPLNPETSDAPLAPGQRLPLSERKQLSPEAVAEIRAVAARYPDPLAGTLPALYIAQREFGFLSLAAMTEVAKALAVPEGHVFGVATFYTMFRKQPSGRYHFQVCTNLCCALNGANELLRKVAEKTGAVPGEAGRCAGLPGVFCDFAAGTSEGGGEPKQSLARIKAIRRAMSASASSCIRFSRPNSQL